MRLGRLFFAWLTKAQLRQIRPKAYSEPQPSH